MKSKILPIVSAITSVLLIAAFSFAFYKVGCSKGEENGYESGYNQGLYEARKEAKKDIAAEHEVGYYEGYRKGYSDHLMETIMGDDYLNSDTESQTVYISKTGNKYHRAGCQYINKNFVATTLENAILEGYTPCSKCW